MTSDSTMLNNALKQYSIEFNPTKLVHGEQYLQIYRPLSITGSLKSTSRVVDVLDKGSGALVILETDTFDAETGEKVFYNQSALFLVGAGRFGGKKMSEKPEVKSVIDAPNRDPDFIIVEKTSSDQAALYRLTGDKNPLHIDPNFSSMGGFEKPILHGLCTYGYLMRHIMKQFASNDATRIVSLKARFAASVYPGQTIETRMWREGNRIHAQVVCKEQSDKVIISGAYADLTQVTEVSPLKVPTSVTDESNPSPAELAFDTDDANMLLTDVIFEEIGRRIAMAPQLSKKVNGIFTFVIVKDRQEVKVWTMDMKTTPGKLYQGHSQSAPADCVIRITDQDMTALAVGELDPVRAFMTGKLKIKGNLMATQRLQALFELNSAEVYEKDGTPPTEAKMNAYSTSGDGNRLDCSSPSGPEISTTSSSSAFKVQFSPDLHDKWSDMGRLAAAGSSLLHRNNFASTTDNSRNSRQQQLHYLPSSSSSPFDAHSLHSIHVNRSNMSPLPESVLFDGSPNLTTSWSMSDGTSSDDVDYDKYYLAAPGDNSSSGGSSGGSGITPIIDLLFEKWLPTRLDDLRELVPVIKTVYQWNILQKGQVASVWTLDLKNGSGAIHRGPPKSGKADCILSLEDDNAVKIFEGKEDAMKAFMTGKLKIAGNVMAAQKLQQVWADEAEKVRDVLTQLRAGKEISGGASPAAQTAASGEDDPDVKVRINSS